MRKIIFVVIHPFFQRDYHRFGAEYLVGKGYSVEIWRVLSEKPINFVASASLYKGDNYHEYDYCEFTIEIDNHAGAIYVLLETHSEASYEIIIRGYKYMLVTGTGGVFLWNDTHSLKFSSMLWEKTKRAFQRGVYQSAIMLRNKIVQKQDEKRYLSAMRKNTPIQILTSTHNVARIYMNDWQLTGNVLYTHALDYDRYIEENRRKDTDLQKYIVFCDSGIGAVDYDSVLNNYESINNQKLFLRQVELLLSRLEEEYNLPAIILGHPHTKYRSDTIYGRKIFFDRSVEFTKKAEIFVLNVSTAINFAALYDIPTLFLVNNAFKQWKHFYPNLYEHIEYEARNIFGCGFLNMDDEEAMRHPWDYVKRMDPEKRKQYIRDYIVDNDTTDKCSYEYLEEILRPIVYGKQ